MPKNPVMLSNYDALKEGNEIAAWKIQKTWDYFDKVTYKISDIKEFDYRDTFTLCPLLIDISEVMDQPESVKKAYFERELKKFEQDFILTKDPSTRIPYLRRIYNEIATHCNIDWDDPKQIEHLFCSVMAQQAIGTMAEKLPREILSLCTTEAQAKEIELVNIKNANNIGEFQAIMSSRYPDMVRNIRCSPGLKAGPFTELTFTASRHFTEPSAVNDNVVIFDPTSSEIIKKHLLGDEFDYVSTVQDFPDDPTDIRIEHYTQDDVARNFTESVTEISRKTVNEARLINVFNKGAVHDYKELVFINGRTLRDIFDEKLRELGGSDKSRLLANVATGKIFRDAITDGRSVVTVMRPLLLENGKVSMNHQEIKVDLDKLNKIERKEKHNAFRRFLDYIHIYKIKPKYASNEARDAVQAEFKRSEEYKNGLKEAEKNFIKIFNENAKKSKVEEQERLEKDPTTAIDPFLAAYPEVSLLEENDEPQINNQASENEPNRHSIVVNEVLENSNSVDVEPIKNDESLNRNTQIDI